MGTNIKLEKNDTTGSEHHRKQINTQSQMNSFEEDKVIQNNNWKIKCS